MGKYVLGLFDKRENAERAVFLLNELDLPDTDYGLFSRHEDFREGLDAEDEEGSVGKSAAIGAAAGGASGVLVGTVAGASIYLIPGLGQIAAAGTLGAAIITAITGTGIGAAAGGFMGALMGYGASEEDANFYMEGMERGGHLLVVDTPDRYVQDVAHAMEEAGVVNVEARREEWKAQGWESYDVHVEPEGKPGTEMS